MAWPFPSSSPPSCAADYRRLRKKNPSAENQARWIFQEMRALLGDMAGHLVYVRVWETPNQYAQYSLKPTW